MTECAEKSIDNCARSCACCSYGKCEIISDWECPIRSHPVIYLGLGINPFTWTFSFGKVSF